MQLLNLMVQRHPAAQKVMKTLSCGNSECKTEKKPILYTPVLIQIPITGICHIPPSVSITKWILSWTEVVI